MKLLKDLRLDVVAIQVASILSGFVAKRLRKETASGRGKISLKTNEAGVEIHFRDQGAKNV